MANVGGKGLLKSTFRYLFSWKSVPLLSSLVCVRSSCHLGLSNHTHPHHPHYYVKNSLFSLGSYSVSLITVLIITLYSFGNWSDIRIIVFSKFGCFDKSLDYAKREIYRIPVPGYFRPYLPIVYCIAMGYGEKRNSR